MVSFTQWLFDVNVFLYTVFKFTLHVWILKGIPNGVSEEKKGNKRSLAEERFVSLLPSLPLSLMHIIHGKLAWSLLSHICLV